MPLLRDLAMGQYLTLLANPALEGRIQDRMAY